MLNIVLFEPEIPPNTGNIIRLCANTGFRLHIIEPMGFAWDDKRLRRAGLDYHEYARVAVHDDLPACLAALGQPRLFAFTARAGVRHVDVRFADGDALLFGRETAGLSDDVLAAVPPAQRLRLPMRPDNRSINLSNTVAVMVYEAWRQAGFAGGI